MFKKIILITLFIFLILACEDDSSLLISDEEFIVVWGFVYAGEQVDDIQLTGTLNLDADSSAVPPPINDADVCIIKDKIKYNLIPSSGDSGYYYYDGNDLIIEPGDVIELTINWNEQEVFAESVVPNAPKNVNISDTTYKIPNFDDFESFMDWRNSDKQEVEITWEVDDPDDWYYISMINIEDNPVPVESIFGDQVVEFVFPPIKDSSYRIRLPLVEHLGRHEIKVYKVNQEYVDLYESREQDSRDLNEPLTNIEGGLGVFSAFNYETIYIEIEQMEGSGGTIEI